MKDLEWLARNVPVDAIYGLVRKDGSCFTDCTYTGYSPDTYTKSEVDAERERLINRPKFEDHPDAKCFVQNVDGQHYKHINTEKVLAISDEWKSGEFGWCYVQKGEVIGDWKDSLMVRPEPVIDPVVVTNVEAFNSVDFAMKLSGADEMIKVGGKAILSNEHNYNIRYMSSAIDQEVTVMSVFTDSNGDRIAAIESEEGCGCFMYSMLKPIRTEEDKAIKELEVIINLNINSARSAAVAIYKSGYKKS